MPFIRISTFERGALPFAPSSFDAVVSGFGVGHFSRPERVLSEFARVLVPKGRVALAWWDGFGKNRINGIFFEAINELGISASGALPAGPAVDRFSDPDQFAAILRAADFEVVGVDYISFAYPLKTVDELWDLALGSFVRVSTVILAQSAEVQQRIRDKVEQMARQYASPNGLQIPIAFRVIAGLRWSLADSQGSRLGSSASLGFSAYTLTSKVLPVLGFGHAKRERIPCLS